MLLGYVLVEPARLTGGLGLLRCALCRWVGVSIDFPAPIDKVQVVVQEWPA
jgi:hypothetical protein